MCRVIAWAVITDQDKNASNIIPYICRRLKANIPNGMAHTIDEQPHTVYSAWFSSQINEHLLWIISIFCKMTPACVKS